MCSQLYHFSDASKEGYGTVTYIRLKNCNGDVHVAFLMGKARVTPLKTITVPRLELTAAALDARVDVMLKEELSIQFEKSVLWTDSTSVSKYFNTNEE